LTEQSKRENSKWKPWQYLLLSLSIGSATIYRHRKFENVFDYIWVAMGILPIVYYTIWCIRYHTATKRECSLPAEELSVTDGDGKGNFHSADKQD